MTLAIECSLVFFTAIIISSVAPAVFAYPDCYRECMDVHSCGSSMDSSYCSSVQARCSTDCRNKGPGGGKSYGAIAYSTKKGAYGYSHGWTNKTKAEKVATKNCSENGKGCKSRVWFYNSCGAVAADGGKVTWGQGPTAQEASNKALGKCKNGLFRKHCEVKVSHCSG